MLRYLIKDYIEEKEIANWELKIHTLEKKTSSERTCPLSFTQTKQLQETYPTLVPYFYWNKLLSFKDE